MKSKILPLFIVIAVSPAVHATNGTWTNLNGGSWATAANWGSSVIADGADGVADFSTIDITADRTVTLDGVRTIGTMKFGDAANTNFNWSLAPGTGDPLTLATTTGSPTIQMVNRQVIITTVLAGTQGLTKTGGGMTVLNAANTYTGPTAITSGALKAMTPGSLPGYNSPGSVTLSSGTTLAVGVGAAGQWAQSDIDTLLANATFASGSNLGFDTTGASFVPSVISGSIGIVKTGTNSLTLGSGNTYTGTTNIGLLGAADGGTLVLSADNALAQSAGVAFGGLSIASGTNGTLSIGSTTQTIKSLTLTYNPSAAATIVGSITGTGSLTVDNGASTPDLVVTHGGGGVQLTTSDAVCHLDMSGLTTFEYKGSATSKVRVEGGAAANNRCGRMTLGANAKFTALSFNVQNVTAPSGDPRSSDVFLGNSTTINADTITVLGTNSKDSGSIKFRSGLATGPTLKLRATDGSGRTNISIATTATATNSATGTGAIDLVTVSPTSILDAMVGTLQIGSRSAGTQTHTATFSMATGTLDATAINLGTVSSGGLNSNFTVAGGTVKVPTLTIGTQTAGTLTCNFNLNSGSTLSAQTIQNGTGTATRNFNWNDGSITTIDASTDLTIGTGLKLAATGAHTFNIPVDRTATVSGVVSDLTTGGSLTKTGDGKVILSATNTYTGDTLVNGGVLSLGNASLADTADVKLTNGAVLDLTHNATDIVDEFYIDGVQQSTGIWGSLASSAPHKTDRITGTGLLRVITGVASDPYADWVFITGLTPGVNDARNLDPDNDGLINFREYALDGNPLSGSRSGKVVGKVATLTIDTIQQKVLTLTLPVRATPGFSGTTEQISDVAEGVIYHIQCSADLSDWTSIPVLEVPADQRSALQTSLSLPTLTAGISYRSFYIPGSDPALSPKLFMRAKVVESP